MMNSLRIVTPAASDPLSLADAKLHLRVDISDDDDLISALITAATKYAEDYSGRAGITRTLALVVPCVPGSDQIIRLPMPGFQTTPAITSIYYRASADGASTLWDSANYELAHVGEWTYGVRPVYNGQWPSDLANVADTMTITYTTGEALSTTVDARLILAIKLMVADWYEHREDSAEMQLRTIPRGVSLLLKQIQDTNRRVF